MVFVLFANFHCHFANEIGFYSPNQQLAMMLYYIIQAILLFATFIPIVAS